MPYSSEQAADVRVPLLMVEGVQVPDERFGLGEEHADSSTPLSDPVDAHEEDKDLPFPPSYNDVMRADLNQRSKWETFKEHMSALSQCVPEGLRESVADKCHTIKVGLYRLWPQSRLSHVFLVLVGLWLLFALSGSSLTTDADADGAFWSWEDIQPYETLPLPLPGDGHVLQSANWTMKGCNVESTPNNFAASLFCTVNTEFELDVPPSFGAGDHLYVLVDPPHEGELPSEDKRGSAKGMIRFVEDPVDNGAPEDLHAKVKVIVQAKYDKMKERYFRGANVVKLGSNSFHQGVGVYTRPIPGKYAVEWDITVLVPKHTPIPMFDVKTKSMHVSLFDEMGPSVVDPSKNSAAQVKKAERGEALAPRHFDNIHMDESTVSHFGALNIQTDSGHVIVGWALQRPLETAGVFTIRTRSGDILIGGNINAHMLDFATEAGAVRVGPDMKLSTWREATIRTKAGRIELNAGSQVRATTLDLSSDAGSIVSLSTPKIPAGKLFANHSLALDLGAGAIGPLSIEVEKPQLFGFRPTEPFSDIVTVKAQAKAGKVDLDIAQADQVPVQVDAVSAAGSVNVHLGQYFAGWVELTGRKGSKVLSLASNSDLTRVWKPAQKTSGGKVTITGTLDRMGVKEISEKSHVKLNSSAGKAKLELGR